jgi:hypothetical protein
VNFQHLRSTMSAGYITFANVFLSHTMIGIVAVLFRVVLGKSALNLGYWISEVNCESAQPKTKCRGIVRIGFLLLFVTLLLPPYPWRHMTATLYYNIAVAAFTIMQSKHSSSPEEAERSLLMEGYYNPTEDPYYISNLDQPIHDFILRALEGTEFTNIMHIILESMGEDSFPFQNDGLLSTHIHSSPRVKIVETINNQTLTPFITSLAEHTLEWHTVWTTIPFTHKSMLGCTSFIISLMTISLLRHAPYPTRLGC